ncbi:sialic acid-binding Ig-like lectin 15 [Gracilinanus agilis]|uniref:sialic acid-binding Ig-like lectin 15 n=1 Tax=Gracilinanus agilis TaxID=191870 RepID=UPI001CFC96A0|nr:sialic acid-binding Ig-like lectin 15 [Gracilinanus agilis]
MAEQYQDKLKELELFGSVPAIHLRLSAQHPSLGTKGVQTVQNHKSCSLAERSDIETAPRIINITVLPGPDHIFSARCTAEGEPLPSLTWTGPSTGNGTSTYSQSHQITKELHALAQDGRYTCIATNSLGHAEGSVYFYKFRAAGDSSVLLTLLFALGIKLLLLLVILGAFVCQSKATHSAAQETLSRPQVQESSYENLHHSNNRTPPAAAAAQ